MKLVFAAGEFGGVRVLMIKSGYGNYFMGRFWEG